MFITMVLASSGGGSVKHTSVLRSEIVLKTSLAYKTCGNNLFLLAMLIYLRINLAKLSAFIQSSSKVI